MTDEIALKQSSADWDISQAIASDLKRPWNPKGRMWRSLGLVKGCKGLIPSKLVQLVEL